MTKIKNTKKGMAKKTLSMSLVVAMLATSNVPVWAAEFSDGTDVTAVTSEAETFSDIPSVEDEIVDNAQGADATITTADTLTVSDVKKNGISLTTNWKKDSSADASIELKSSFDQLIDKKADFTDGAEIKLHVDASNFTNVKIGDQYTCKLSLGGKVVATKTITITGETNQEYVDKQFKLTEPWGTKLSDELAKDHVTLLGGLNVSSISGVEWYDNSDVLQASNYETKQGDVAKTYTAKATLTTPLGASEVTLGTVTIKEKDAVPGNVKSATWDSGTVDTSGNVTFTYDGTAHYPQLTQVILNDGTKINATDEGVTITYTKLLEADATTANDDKGGVPYTATITTPKYNVTYNTNLIINRIDLEKAGTLNVGKGFEFNPSSSTYAVSKDLLDNAGLTVTASGKTLEYAASGKDYTVALSAPDNKVGTDKMTVTVTGTGNYKGSIIAKAPINAYELKDEDVSDVADVTFDGNAKEPSVTVKYKTTGLALTPSEDYTVSYSNNTNVGTATVKVEGKGNYTGTVEKTFEIKNGNFNELVSEIQTDLNNNADKCVYTGKPIDLVKDNYCQYRYRKGTDFIISYEPQNVNVGKVNVKIIGQGNYKGNTGEATLYITARSIADKDVKVNVQGLTYSTDMTDKQITDATTLTYNGMTLVENTDYEVKVVSRSGKNIVLSIKGLGNYNNARTETVSVTAKDINTVTLPKIDAQKYSGYDFVVSGNQVQTNSTKVADFEIKDGNYTLVENKDYKISSYENNKSVGTAKINIVGIGAYSGKATISFPIVAKELNGTIMYATAHGVTALLPDKEYNYKDATSSKGYTFDFSNTIAANNLVVIGEDGQPVSTDNYTVTYADNKAAGTATITVEGKGGYKLNAVNTFKIVPAKLSTKVTTVSVKGAPFYYTGEAIEPELTVNAKDDTYKLVKDVDYKVEYSDNVNVGTAKVKLVGLGNYAGVLTAAEETGVSASFAIAQTVIRDTDISVADTPYAGGITVTPNITIKNQYSNKALVEGTDYTVEVTKGGVNVGQAKAKIKLTTAAAKNYSLVGGTEYSVNFNVTALDLSKATVSPIADQAATGEQIKPAVTVMNGSVKLTEGKDYEVSYGENKEIGEGTVTIKALSSNKNYTGSQTVKFNIVKDAPVVGKTMISDVKVVGNKATVILSGDADGASGYDYVISTDKDCTTSKDYDAISKNQVKTSTAFKYVQKGTYYAYCHAWTRDKNGKKVFGDWSEGYEFKVKATTPAAPVITEVKVKGSTITVTYNKVSNVAGYDVVLGTSSKNDNGELRPYRYGDHKILNINKNKVTVQFKNVPKKNWVVGMRSFTKDPDTNKKVFSRWSNLMPANMK